MNVAIFSPNKLTYSETFIMAHKNLLKGNIYYYYGTLPNIKLEGKKLINNSLRKWWLRICRKISGKPYNYIFDNLLLMSLKQYRIDVILVEYGSHANHLMSILKQSKIPFIVHFHGFDASVKKVIDSCENYVQVFKYAERIVVVSKVMWEKLVNVGCPKEKLIYTVCGPREEFFNVAPKFKKKQFISVGRFTDKKAPYYTILAFKIVVNKHPEARLLMAGEGVLYNTCKNIINLYKLEQNVILLGVINANEFRELLSDSLAFVQHSITAENGDMEGTPVSILEASAAGLPIVSTLHAGIPDVVIHNKTGLLSEEHKINEMALNMLKLLDDKQLAKNLGIKGREFIKNNFTLFEHINILQKTLESICD